jgi:tRNA A37 threonylcarbamoyladenosine synthetase subunit TsaC/SUA5/YrdC
MPVERTHDKILEQFKGRSSQITHMINIGELPLSEPSTVVDARGDKPVIIREGAISKKEIFDALK